MDERIEGDLIPSSGKQLNFEGLKKPSIHFQDWLQVVAHTHTKILSEASELLNWQDGQLPHRTLREILRQLGEKKGGFYLVDSDHAAHCLDVYHPSKFPEKTPDEVRKLRRQAFQGENLSKTIDIISQRVLERAKIVKEQGGERVYTGVEADILDEGGNLDVNLQKLSQLDYVGASLHQDEWRDVNKGEFPTVDKILFAYERLSLNSLVDVINHPIRELPEGEWGNVLTEENKRRWETIFKNLAQRGACLEINLRDLIDPKREKQNEIYLQLISLAKANGVKFILGADFHRIEQYGRSFPDEEKRKLEEVFPSEEDFYKKVAEEESYREDYVKKVEDALKEIFAPGEGLLAARNILALARPIYQTIRKLQEAGIMPEDVVNGEEKRFREWVTERKKMKMVAISKETAVKQERL